MPRGIKNFPAPFKPGVGKNEIDGLGYDDYLTYLGEEALAESINQQIEKAIAQIGYDNNFQTDRIE